LGDGVECGLDVDFGEVEGVGWGAEVGFEGFEFGVEVADGPEG
jgi:hypothetical protein